MTGQIERLRELNEGDAFELASGSGAGERMGWRGVVTGPDSSIGYVPIKWTTGGVITEISKVVIKQLDGQKTMVVRF